jgi:hypothetical protein
VRSRSPRSRASFRDKPYVSPSSSVNEVASWFSQQPLSDEHAKKKIVDLIVAEGVDGAQFCRYVATVDDLEKQFDVQFRIADRATLRTALCEQ